MAALAKKQTDVVVHDRAAVGKTRAVSVVSHKTLPGFELLVLHRRHGRWTISERLPLRGTLLDRHNDEEQAACEGKPLGDDDDILPRRRLRRRAASIRVRDLDRDGKPEALIRTDSCTETFAMRHLFVVNLDPGKLRLGANVAVEYGLVWAGGGTVGHTRAKVRFVDENGDGHPDLRLMVSYHHLKGAQRWTKRRYLLYRPAVDRWSADEK